MNLQIDIKIIAGIVRYNNKYLASFNENDLRIPMNNGTNEKLMIDYNG